ncbi:autophagy-related protein 17 [Fennellomyces sp. T-0311]|nr:autophagy-related protein 17 [Fennellomyces sp. T-0311]
MEQELIELLLFAKKALSRGQAICAQANQLSNESDHHSEIIERTWPKILFVRNHILIQLSTLERIREFLSVKIEEVRSCIKDREETFGKVTLDLQNIFRVLENCNIDEGILKFNNEQRKQTTLFDYIDHHSVLELRKQADDEISEIENLCSSLMSTAKTLSNTISELASLQEAALTISLDESASSFSTEKTQIRESITTKMAEILTSLTNHYDQLGEATRLCQSDPDAQLDISVLQRDHDQLPIILEELEESLDFVESITEEIRVRMQVYSSVQEELLKVLLQLEKFSTPGGQADIICEKMISAEGEMKAHEQNLGAYFKELMSLADWYQVYAASYSHLVLEIERRRKAMEKQDELYQELLKSFEDSYNDELQERSQWFAQHGEYLPQDLCQFMMDPPSRLSVQIEEEPRRLPELSKATVKKTSTTVAHHDERRLYVV